MNLKPCFFGLVPNERRASSRLRTLTCGIEGFKSFKTDLGKAWRALPQGKDADESPTRLGHRFVADEGGRKGDSKHHLLDQLTVVKGRHIRL